MTAKTSILLWLVARNLPLGHCDQYTEEDVHRMPATSESWSDKAVRKIAQRLVNGLSQCSVTRRLAEEWELLSPRLRMDLTDIANSPNHSGNVRKGILYLDELLGGKVRRREVVQTERQLISTAHGVIAVRRIINPAVAGGERAFAGFRRPANYESLPAAEKKRINQQMARERREEKRR